MNEQVLNRLPCTWMTIIDSQLYIIDSLSLAVPLERYANLVVVCLNFWQARCNTHERRYRIHKTFNKFQKSFS